MTIDTCTRIWHEERPWPGPSRSVRFEAAAYERAMQCVDVAFVLGARADRLDVHVSAEQVAAFVNRLPDRRLGFAGIDPLAPDPIADVDRALGLALVGIVLSPADAGCRPTHERFAQVLEHAAARGAPVIISNPALLHRRSVLEFARHALLDEPLGALPDLRVLLSDLGLVPLEETLSLLAKHENVFAEISSLLSRPTHLHRTITLAHERNVAHKLFLGSGYPDATPRQALEDLYRANSGGSGPTTNFSPPIPRAVLHDIAERNPFPYLGIDAPTRRGAQPSQLPATRLPGVVRLAAQENDA